MEWVGRARCRPQSFSRALFLGSLVRIVRIIQLNSKHVDVVCSSFLEFSILQEIDILFCERTYIFSLAWKRNNFLKLYTALGH